MHLSTKFLLVPALLLASCKGDPEAAKDGSTTSDGSTASDAGTGSTDATGSTGATVPTTGSDTGEPTYWQDVAPIYFDRCVTCHQAGGIAPFRLDDYAVAKQWAAPSASAVAARTMPPWLMTADGSCGEFSGSRALAHEEITMIEAWAAGGALEGTPRDDLAVPPVPTLADGLDLSTPKFTPEIAGGPLAEFDEYRCFLVDPKLATDMFLTGYDVTPGTPALVHHVLAMPVDPNRIVDGGLTNAQRMQAFDAESPDRDGWPCFSQAGEGVAIESLPVTWAPGMGVVEYPKDTGVRLAAGNQVVIQIHYNLHDASLQGQSDQTTVRLRLADEVAREGFFDFIDPFINTLFEGEPATLEPGQESVKYTWTVPLGQFYLPPGAPSIEVHGIFPHMHERGRKWSAKLIDGDAEQCIGEVDAWDFDWQLYYFYEQPMLVGPDTKLEVTCDFDTRGAAGPVKPGWGTQNEMCLAGLFVVP